MLKKQVKLKTTLPKFRRVKSSGRLKEIESSAGGTAKDVICASQANNLSDGQCGSEVENRTESGLKTTNSNLFVPVVDSNNKPLMPTTCSRAKRWIKSRKATGFWKRGIYCVRLNVEPSSRKIQEIVVGIDTGSKREAFTVKSELHTYLNIQAEAVDWVKENVETRRNLRKSRRNRTTPCRKNKSNRVNNRKRVPPSTKARWQLKLRVFNWLKKMYPITHCIVEDVKARTLKNGKKWNRSFSPLEVGKNWFYGEIKKMATLETKTGYDTKELRDAVGLTKIKNKLSERFEAHCVDSWVLANSVVGGHITPDNKRMLLIRPLRFYRRQLHVQNPSRGGQRKNYGGTISMGFKRGSIVTHKKYSLCFIGGASKEKVSLHNLIDGKRLCQNANPSDIKFLAYNSFLTRTAIPPQPKGRGFLAEIA